jgi:hypothetical protein
MDWGTVELEPEVRDWLESLSTLHFATAAFYVDLVADRGPLLGEPYTRQLDGKLRELRFHLDGRAVRVTYWIAPGRRIVLLTVFAKTRMREVGEVERARRAMARCMAQEHTVEDDDD